DHPPIVYERKIASSARRPHAANHHEGPVPKTEISLTSFDAARRRAHNTARERQERPNLRNFSRKRPEITNLNHQYAIRRVFMALIRATKAAHTASITPEPARAGNVLQ